MSFCSRTTRLKTPSSAILKYRADKIDSPAYPNVDAWLKRMKVRPSWEKVYAAITGFAQQLPRGQLATV